MEFGMESGVEFGGRMLVLGCGSVAQCTLPLLLRRIAMPPDRITVMDFVDNRGRIGAELAQGVQYVRDRVERDNMHEKLSAHAGPGDIILDLAWNIDCCEILEWCRDNGVRYLNTSVELWDPYGDARVRDPRERSLYVRHLNVRRMLERWRSRPGSTGPTAVIEHGANPGLVSHMVKEALTSIAARALDERPEAIDASTVAAIQEHLAVGDYARLSMSLGVKVIHVAERDTQITDRPKEVDEFVNTWSVEGFYEEGVAPAEMGWGTHERRMPADAYVHQYGPSNQIALSRMGIDTLVRSWTPAGEIVGMVVRHGEAFTISDHLTVWDDGPIPVPLYRPTVHYAYCPADVAWASLIELRARHLVMQPSQRILNDEVISGADFMGVLLMGHPYKSWWTGSCLSIDEARALVPHQNATTLQVAASIVAATAWMIRNPQEGVNVPDQLPWREILRDAKPYLGTYHDAATDWTPLQNRVEYDLYSRFQQPQFNAGDDDETWQFTTFRVH